MESKQIIKINGIENVQELNLSAARIKGAEGLSVSATNAPEETVLAENERAIEISGLEQGIEYKGLSVVIEVEGSEEPISAGLNKIYLPTEEELEAIAAKEAATAEKAAAKQAAAEAKAAAKAEKLAAKAEAKAAKIAAKEAATAEKAEAKAAAEAAKAEEAEKEENFVNNKELFESSNESFNDEVITSVEETVAEEVEYVEEIVELSPEEIREARLNEVVAAEKELTNGWLEQLKEQEANTEVLERKLREIEIELEQVTEVAEASEAEYAKESEKVAELKTKWQEAKGLSDAAIKSAGAVELSDALREKLQADADEATATTEEALEKYEAQQQVSNEVKAKAKEDRLIANGVASELNKTKKEIANSVKQELKIKDIVIINLSNKGKKINNATKSAWRAEDEASLAIFKAKKAEKELKAENNATEKTFAAVEEAEIKVSQEADEEVRQILEAELAQLRKAASNASSKQAKAEKNYNKLIAAADKAVNKSENLTFVVELWNAEALISQEAARKVQKMIINELEGRVSTEKLSEDEKLLLIQEIDLLKAEETKEIALDEATDRPKFIIADDMAFAEKWVKGRYTKTYWVIFERGYRSRDEEFEKFIASQKEEREAFLLEIKEKQESAQKEIENKQAEAAAKLEEIKANAEAEVQRAKEKVEQAKKDGEAMIASQKDALDAKLHEAENLVKDNNAKNAEIVSGLEKTITDNKVAADKEISDIKSASAAEVANLNKEIQTLNTNTSDLKARITKLEADLEATEKARSIAERKASLLSQIENIVEEERK